jgi:hypothetical protein
MDLPHLSALLWGPSGVRLRIPAWWSCPAEPPHFPAGGPRRAHSRSMADRAIWFGIHAVSASPLSGSVPSPTWGHHPRAPSAHRATSAPRTPPRPQARDPHDLAAALLLPIAGRRRCRTESRLRHRTAGLAREGSEDIGGLHHGASARDKLDLPRFRGEVWAWVRLSGLTASRPPFWRHLLVRPRSSFRPGLRVAVAAARSGGQGRPAECRRGLTRRLQAAP